MVGQGPRAQQDKIRTRATQSKSNSETEQWKAAVTSRNDGSGLKWRDSHAVTIANRPHPRQSRAISRLFLTSDGNAEEDKIKLELLEACSSHDYQAAWKRLRKMDNTNLLLTTAEYAIWKDQETSSTLVCTDYVGAGISVLLANMVDDLNSTFVRGTSGIERDVAYFFCESGDEKSLAVSTIMGSLARQTIQGEDAENLDSLHDMLSSANTDSFNEDQLFQIIQDRLTRGREIFVVLDGLDECSYTTRSQVLKLLKGLQSTGILHLCIACQLMSEPSGHRRIVKNPVFVNVSKSSNLEVYVRSEMERLLASGQLVLSDPGLAEEICIALVRRADRMPQWAKCQLSALCHMQTDQGIKEMLKDLPSTLHYTYIRMLNTADHGLIRYCDLMLELTCVAKRALTLSELQEALEITPSDIAYNLTSQEPHYPTVDILQVVKSCGGLVVVDEKDSTVQLINPTARDFLTLAHESPAIFDYSTSSKKMIALLLTYINCGFVDFQMIDTFRQQSDDLRSSDIKEHLQASQPNQKWHSFASYATEFWCDHLSDFDVDDPLCMKLLRNILERPGLDKLLTCARKTPLIVSIISGHVRLFRVLLEYLPSFSITDQANAVETANRNGMYEILEIMIDSKLFDKLLKQAPSFVNALLDGLTGYLLEEEQLNRVVENMPHHLEMFAYRLGHRGMGRRGREAGQFVFKHQDAILSLFQEEWFRRYRDEAKEYEAVMIPLQDPVVPREPQTTAGNSGLSGETLQTQNDQILNDDLTRGQKSSNLPTVRPHVVIRGDIPSLSLLGVWSTSSPIPRSADSAVETNNIINFMLKSTALAWLIMQIRRTIYLTDPEYNALAGVREELSQSFGIVLGARIGFVPSQKTISIRFDWNLPDFLNSFQFEKTEDALKILNSFLTLNSDGRYIQALSIKQYLQQNWGETSSHVLSLLQDLAKDDFGSFEIPGCSIDAWYSGSKTVLDATGTFPETLEIVEQIAWIGSSLRWSPWKQTLYQCYPIARRQRRMLQHLHKQEDENDYSFDVDFAILKANSQKTTDSCWQGLFQYPVLAMGFPVAKRASSISGLEMNLGTMMALGQSQHIGKFDDMIVIKGHSTMFTLSERQNGSCLWHVSGKTDGTYISYSDILHAGKFPHTSLQEIKADRHFVGWCAQSSYGAGSLDADYTVKSSYADYIVENSFFAERRLLRPIKFEADSICIAQDKNEPRQSRHASYRKDINKLHSSYLVLWDVNDDRGWLANGTSVLLHLVLASLDYEAKHALTFHPHFDVHALKSASHGTERTAATILLDTDNLELLVQPEENDDRETFKDRVQDIYHLLEMMIAYQLIACQKGQLSPAQLEGWDFIGIADSSTELLYPRRVALDATSRAWRTLLTDIWAVTLFGRGFGEIFEPMEHTTCEHWLKVPKEQSYLAASVRDLAKIMEKHGNPLREPKKLTHSTAWTVLQSSFEGCACQGSMDHKTVLQHLTIASDIQPNGISLMAGYDAPHSGAVIFGSTPAFDSPPGLARIPNQIISSAKQNIQPEAKQLLSAQETVQNKEREQVKDVPEDQAVFTPLLTIPTHSDFLIAIICALPKELQAIRILFDTKHEQVAYNASDPYSYTFGKIGEHNVVAACLPKGRYGNCSATTVGTHLYNSFRNIKFTLLVGIGGGVPLNADIRLGDVVVSSGNPGVVKYDFHRTRQGQANELLGASLRTPPELDSIISQLSSDPDSKEPLCSYLQTIAKKEPTYIYPGRQCDVLYSAEHVHVGQGACAKCKGRVLQRRERTSDQPRVHYGVIASGDQVMKDAKIRDRLGRQYGALCFEMEAGGLCHLNKDCLVIRGICDYSDSHKHDGWQNYASAAAAAYAKALLSRLRPLIE